MRPRAVRERRAVARRLDVGLEAERPAVGGHQMALVVDRVQDDRAERLQPVRAHGLHRPRVVDVLLLRRGTMVKQGPIGGASVGRTMVMDLRYSMRSESFEPKSLVISCKDSGWRENRTVLSWFDCSTRRSRRGGRTGRPCLRSCQPSHLTARCRGPSPWPGGPACAWRASISPRLDRRTCARQGVLVPGDAREGRRAVAAAHMRKKKLTSWNLLHRTVC